MRVAYLSMAFLLISSLILCKIELICETFLSRETIIKSKSHGAFFSLLLPWPCFLKVGNLLFGVFLTSNLFILLL